MLDTYDIDERIDNSESLPFGEKVKWHDLTGMLVTIKNNKPAIKFRMKCWHIGCRNRITIYTVSGCHNGAFCYVQDPKSGQFLADLRNQNVVCKKHSRQ